MATARWSPCWKPTVVSGVDRRPPRPVGPTTAGTGWRETGNRTWLWSSFYAASEGDLLTIRRLVARGADLEGGDYDHRTPLHLAAAEGHEHIVQYFVDQRIDLAPRDRWGGTPLDDAPPPRPRPRGAAPREACRTAVNRAGDDEIPAPAHPSRRL